MGYNGNPDEKYEYVKRIWRKANALYQKKYSFYEYLHRQKMDQLETSYLEFVKKSNSEFKKVETRVKTKKEKKM